MTDVTPNQSSEDTRVFRAVEEYLAAIQKGPPPDRAQFLWRYPDIANRLSGCLAALEAVEAAAPSAPEAGAGEAAPLLAPGTILGGFRVLRELGRGGMGVVYLAADTRLTRLVALKVMGRTAATSAVARQRFVREAQSASIMHHDHIITIYQADEDGGIPFLAMEFLDGESLEDRLGRGPVALDDAVRIALQTADGLGYAHERGLIHRDIKPANLFLENVAGSSASHAAPSKRARVKILDFGLAKIADGDGRLTESGISLGTPHYMSPEQAAGDAVDPRSDLFSLGCVLYRMLTGVVPFRGDTLRGTIRAVIMDAPTPPRQLRHDVPASLADLTLRLLAKDPGQRPESAAAVSATLRVIEQELAERTSETKDRSSPIGRPRVRVAVGVVAALLVIAALAVGYFNWPDKAHVEPAPLFVAPLSVAPSPPFVLLPADGTAASSFATLADAVAAADSGDAIELRGNGPFLSPPLDLGKKALVIRAGAGFWPILRQTPETVNDASFLTTRAQLVLEGLELQRFNDDKQPVTSVRFSVAARDGGCFLANCRWVSKTATFSQTLNINGPRFEARNCIVLLATNIMMGTVHTRSMKSAVVDNNLIAGDDAKFHVGFNDNHGDFSFVFSRNTQVGCGLGLTLGDEPKPRAKAATPRLQLDIRDSVIAFNDSRWNAFLLAFQQWQPSNAAKARAMRPVEAEVYLRHVLTLNEERNAFSDGGLWFSHLIVFERQAPTWDAKSFAGWQSFWGHSATTSLIGRIKCRGGELARRANDAPQEITPADFRLAADSVGKGAGANGADRGADVDLVGPGPAYEAWKKTPAYQQWLKDTGQQK